MRQPEKGVHRTVVAGAMVDMAAGQSRHSRAGQTKSRRCSPFKQLSLYMGVMGNYQRVAILGVCSFQHKVALKSIC